MIGISIPAPASSLPHRARSTLEATQDARDCESHADVQGDGDSMSYKVLCPPVVHHPGGWRVLESTGLPPRRPISPPQISRHGAVFAGTK